MEKYLCDPQNYSNHTHVSKYKQTWKLPDPHFPRFVMTLKGGLKPGSGGACL